MYSKNIVLIGVYPNVIPELNKNINTEFKVELESGELQSIKILQDKGNLVTAEYFYLGNKRITVNKQKINEINKRIRIAVDELYKENFN